MTLVYFSICPSLLILRKIHASVRLYPHTLEEILIDLEPVTVLHSVHREVLRVELAEEFKCEHT